jgi:hypothetical protein
LPSAISEQELKAIRAREARARYTQKKKAERLETEAKLEEGRRELEKLRLEQQSLQDHAASLSSMGSYASCMIQALTEAKQTARLALNTGLQGLGQAQDWARHQYIMLPTAVELMTTTLWTPTEAQMRWALQSTNTEEYENGHKVFFNRIAELLKEGQRCPSSQERVEKRVVTLMTLWLKFTLILVEERKDHMEQHLCANQVREFKQHQREAIATASPTPAASVGGAGSDVNIKSEDRYEGERSVSISPAAAAVAAAYEEEEEDEENEVVGVQLGPMGITRSGSTGGSAGRRPHISILPNQQPTDLGVNFPILSLQQINGLDAEWIRFKRSVRGARKDLNTAVGQATAAYIANVDFMNGLFNAESMSAMAESYLMTVDAATAADSFVRRESRAYMELFVNIIQLLTPLQLAHLKTAPNIQPLIPHLPLVCHLLLQQADVMGTSDDNIPNKKQSSDGSDGNNAGTVVEVPRVQQINE